MTFDDFNNLTPSQRATLEEFRQIGLLAGPGNTPDISGVTDNQAKQAANWLNGEAMALLNPTINGVRYVRQFHKDAAAKAYDDGIIPGP